MNKPDLGDLMMGRGWIDRSQLNRALAIQRQIPGRLGSCLLEIDAATENQLLAALSEQMGVPEATPEDLRDVPADVIRMIPAKLAVRCQAVPFRATGNRLAVAMADTRDLALQDELAFVVGKRLEIHVASEARILEALDRYYGSECPARYTRLLDRLNRSRYLWNRESGTSSAASQPERRPTERTAGFRDVGRSYSPPAKGLSGAVPAELAPTAPRRDPVVTKAAAASVPKTAPATALPTAEAAPALPATSYPEPPTLKLTDEEREALESSERQLSSKAGGEGLRQRLGRQTGREAVGRVLLESLRGRFRRAAILVVGTDGVRGWLGTGAGFDEERFAQLRVDFEQPSAFLNLHLGSPFVVGPLTTFPAHERFLACWHRRAGERPVDCWLVPVLLRRRLVVILYGEDLRTGGLIGGLPTLQWLGEEAAKAFEDCILRKKAASADRATEV